MGAADGLSGSQPPPSAMKVGTLIAASVKSRCTVTVKVVTGK